MRTSLSGPVLYAVQATLPLLASRALSQPRTPNSPPLLPTSTFPLTTRGDMVTVSPLWMSPTLVRHNSLPVLASTAQTWQSRLVMNTLPLANTAPRLTRSQQATPLANGSGFGSYFHFKVPGMAPPRRDGTADQVTSFS